MNVYKKSSISIILTLTLCGQIRPATEVGDRVRTFARDSWNQARPHLAPVAQSAQAAFSTAAQSAQSNLYNAQNVLINTATSNIPTGTSYIKPLVIGSAAYTAGYFLYFKVIERKVKTINNTYAQMDADILLIEDGKPRIKPWQKNIYEQMQQLASPYLPRKLKQSPETIYSFYTTILEQNIEDLNSAWNKLLWGSGLLFYPSELRKSLDKTIARCDHVLSFLNDRDNRNSILAEAKKLPTQGTSMFTRAVNTGKAALATGAQYASDAAAAGAQYASQAAAAGAYYAKSAMQRLNQQGNTWWSPTAETEPKETEDPFSPTKKYLNPKEVLKWQSDPASIPSALPVNFPQEEKPVGPSGTAYN